MPGPDNPRLQSHLREVSPVQRHDKVSIASIGASPERRVAWIRIGFHCTAWFDPFRFFPQQIDESTYDRRADAQFSEDRSVFLENVSRHEPSEGVIFDPVAQQNRAVIRRLYVKPSSRDAQRRARTCRQRL
jgi:hypothetical protein